MAASLAAQVIGAQASAAPALPDPAAVRDTLDAVFRAPAFERSLGQSLWDALVHLLESLYVALRDVALASPSAYWVVVALLAVGAAYAAGRGAVAWDARARRARGAAAGGPGGDPWHAADDAAAAGQLVDAAHLLHAAVVDALARRGLVRAHRSKTIGDYLRELARRGGGSGAHAAYRAFARRYEPFVYAVGAADPARWAALREAADAARAAAAPESRRAAGPAQRPARRAAAGAA